MPRGSQQLGQQLFYPGLQPRGPMGGGVAKNGPWPDLSLQPAPGPLEFQGRCRWPCSLEANSYTYPAGAL